MKNFERGENYANHHSGAEKGAEKKPFFTGKAILSRGEENVNIFFLSFLVFPRYNKVNFDKHKEKRNETNHGD